MSRSRPSIAAESGASRARRAHLRGRHGEELHVGNVARAVIDMASLPLDAAAFDIREAIRAVLLGRPMGAAARADRVC